MKNLFKYLRKSKSSQSSAGFTLTELLIAASMTVVVVGAAGFGMLTMLKNERTAKATSQVQYNLNRAVEFMANEVRTASRIESYVTKDYVKYKTNNLLDLTSDTNATPILMLEIPEKDSTGNSVRVVYYLKKKTNEPWLGPNIIYRWGPNLGIDGQYTNTAPTGWQREAFVDMVADNIDTSQRQCNNNSWTRISTDPNGFFICVRPDGRMAEIHAFSSTNVNTNREPVKYGIDTQIYTRADSLGIVNFVPLNSAGTLIPDRDVTVSVTPVVQDLTCASGTNPTITTLTYRNDPSSANLSGTGSVSNLAVEAGQPVIIMTTAQGGTCNYSASATSGSPNVKAVRDGYTLADITNDTVSQNRLTALLTSRGYLENGRIKLNANQVLYFFETQRGETDPDFNDNIVLVTLR